MADLTTDEKLIALGLKSPTASDNPYRDLFQQLSDAVSFTQFRDDVAPMGMYQALETYLRDTIGMTAEDAGRFRTLVEQKYPEIADFKASLDAVETWDAWEAEFKFGETFGSTGEGTNAGIRVHAESGVSHDGIGVPAGTVEIFGPRVEFSQTQTVDTVSPEFSYTNISVTDDTPQPGQVVDISCNVTNETTSQFSPLIRLLEDGEVVDSQSVTIDGGATETVTFSRYWNDYVSVDLRIENSATVTVVVEPEGVTG